MKVGTLKPSGMALVAAFALVIELEAPAAAHQVAHKISGSNLKPNSVTGKQVKESTLGPVPEAKSLPSLVWHKLTMKNGWASVSSSSRPAAYAVDAQGIVHLRGAITGGADGATDTVAFTLPAKAAPPAGDDVYLPVATAGGEIGYIIVINRAVFPEGASVPAQNAVKAFASLEGITFSTH